LAATYGIAAAHFSVPHTQIVIVGEDETATELYSQAVASCVFGRSVLKLRFSQAVAQNLPPSLAATIPELPAVHLGKTIALVCSGSSCKPPVHSAEQLGQLISLKDSAA